MTDIELNTLADLLEKMARQEPLTDSERHAAIKLVSAADQLVEERKRK